MKQKGSIPVNESGDRRLWEGEDELWEQVARGLKAAVRLGKMSEREAR